MEPGSTSSAAPLLFFFLSARGSAELRMELCSLGAQLGLSACEEDEDLQTDGHSSYNPLSFEEERAQVDLLLRGDLAEEADLRALVEGLIRIADQLENSVVTQATENLIDRLRRSTNQYWKDYLSAEVASVLRGSLGPELNQLPTERVLLALTFTLVKGVCERAPRFLCGLFHAALQYVGDIPFLHSPM